MTRTVASRAPAALCKDFGIVTVSEIRNDRELYEAMNEYTSRIWRWGAHVDDDCDSQPTPDELIDILNERLQWVMDHKRAVEKYLQTRGPRWVRVIDGSKADSAS